MQDAAQEARCAPALVQEAPVSQEASHQRRHGDQGPWEGEDHIHGNFICSYWPDIRLNRVTVLKVQVKRIYY